MSEPSYARRSARVLLLDAADRLLLFKLGDAWFAPGGGLIGRGLVAGRIPSEPLPLPWHH